MAIAWSEAIDLLSGARVGHLSTVTPANKPHVVPVTFVLVDGEVVTAIDHKPKKTRRLRRLTNIEANPAASLLVDHYSDDWDRLWWVRFDGLATIAADHPGAVAEFEDKYQQYRSHPPQGPFIVLTMEKLSWWESTP